MHKSLIINLVKVVAVAWLAQACFAAKEYQRPEDVVNEDLYRTDQLAEDTASAASMSWRDVFTDPILAGHIERALEQNMDIRIALQKIVSAEAYLKQGKAGFYPSIDALAQVNHQQLSENSQFGGFFTQVTQYELSSSISWEADIWGKIRSQKRAYGAAYLQSVEAHKAVKTRLVADVAKMYFQLLSLDEQLRITDTTIKNRKNSLETTKALKEAGNVTEVAVQQTEAQLYTAKALRVDLKNQIRLVENTLNILLARPSQDVKRSKLDAQNMPDSLDVGLPIALLSNRPDVQAAEYNFVNAFELTNVARSNFYPSLTLSATSGFQSLDAGNLISPQSLFLTVVGGLTQPIFNQRKIRTRYENAQAQQQIALLQFRQSLLTAGREVSDALSNLQAADSIVAIRQKELNAYQKATEYSQELLQNGLANYLEVLNARENALSSQLSLIRNRRVKLNASVELYRALGGGWR